MIKRFIVRILGCALGIALAVRYVQNVQFNRGLDQLFLVGLILASLITFIDPILKIIAFPLRLLTLNLFSLVIEMAMIWITGVFSPGFQIEGLTALFFTTVIVYFTNAILWTILSPLLKS